MCDLRNNNLIHIVLGAEYLSFVKFIATDALTFFGYIISVLAYVNCVFIIEDYAFETTEWTVNDAVFWRIIPWK